MSQEERAEPSQALLFRLWRRGFHIYTLNDLTLIIVSAGTSSDLVPAARNSGARLDRGAP